MKIKQLVWIAALGLLASCGDGFKTTEDGAKYKILAHEEGTRGVTDKDVLLVNLRLTTEKSDSLIMETFGDNSARYIPADEPMLKEVFALMAKGDSAEVLVNADSLFKKSFGVDKPAMMKDENNVRFIMKIVDVFSQEELQRKSMEQVKEMMQRDSVEIQKYTSTLTGLKKTESGLMYVVEKEGTGTSPKKGDKVSMKYRGYFTNGETFDENLNREPLEFSLGLQQVIPGWEEAAGLMKKGGKYKLIVPWHLAYGERGSGPIPPCTSLIFDVELVKINE